MGENEKKIRVVVIGATGSVGSSVLDICSKFADRFEVVGLAANSNDEKLLDLAKRFGTKYASLAEPSANALENFRKNGIELFRGERGLCALAELPEADHVVFASSGTDAIVALQQALRSDKDVSLANKESIVAAGPWVMPLVRRHDQLRPVDSEHSAIWQCLRDEPRDRVSKIYLTASGGPFRDWPIERMAAITPEDALKHPVWAMGAKITVDSATLINKGIECIEAMQLFDLPAEKVGALIHPGSLVHGLVVFSDTTVKFLFSNPDMRLPSAAALAWPDRLELQKTEGFGVPSPETWRLEFHEPDMKRFPCLRLALDAGKSGGAYPPLLIGADQAAVMAFLERRIPFLKISHIIESVLEKYDGPAPTSLLDALALIAEGTRMAEEACLVSGG